MRIVCAYCNQKTDKPTGAVNRAKKLGAPVYCNKKCAGLGRRDTRTKAEKVEAKRLYDMEYRSKNAQMLKAKKHNYFKETYDPDKARIERKKNMARHVEYCRRPEYKAKKKAFDRVYRAKKYYGDYWEAFLLTLDIDEEVFTRVTRYQIYQDNGTLNKKLMRRKDYERSISNQP